MLENNEDMWMDMLEKNNGNIHTVKRGDSVPDEYKSDITPKYTFEKGRLKDWSDAGIQRFNELREMVVNNRLIHFEFDDLLKCVNVELILPLPLMKHLLCWCWKTMKRCGWIC